MGKADTPPPPDYAGIAKQQGQSSKELTEQQLVANRPNVYTPWGSQTWQRNGDQWTQNNQLSPQQQNALDSQMAVTQGRSQAAQGLLGQATRSFSSPMGYSGIASGGGPLNSQQAQSGFDGGGNVQRGFSMGGDVQSRMGATAGDWRQRGQDAALSFMRPQQEQRQAALESQLSNQGLTRGSQAWNTEMMRNADQTTRDSLQAFGAGQSEAGQLFSQDLQGGQFANQAQAQRYGQNQGQAAFNNQAQGQQFSQGQAQGGFANQAAQQNNMANLQAGNFNQQLRQQQIAERLQQRNQPLNELNSLLGGQQINSPNMPTFNLGGKAENPQLMNAANQGYQANMDSFNAQSAGRSGMMQGIGSLAAAAAMAFSDKRLKDDIKPLFSLGGEDNIKLYSFNFKPTGERKVGVLAQEVQKKRPDAVMQDPESGFLKVDYNKVFQ